MKPQEIYDAVKNSKSYKTVWTTDVAKLIRHQLRARWPQLKFSVRSHKYSGGSSIDVTLATSQPDETLAEIKKFLHGYEGRGFDGMTDCSYCKSQWLMPDGTMTFASTPGTGMSPAKSTIKPHPDAIEVSSGANYVFLYTD